MAALRSTAKSGTVPISNFPFPTALQQNGAKQTVDPASLSRALASLRRPNSALSGRSVVFWCCKGAPFLGRSIWCNCQQRDAICHYIRHRSLLAWPPHPRSLLLLFLLRGRIIFFLSVENTKYHRALLAHPYTYCLPSPRRTVNKASPQPFRAFELVWLRPIASCGLAR